MRFDNVINWGHILMAVSFMIPAFIFGVGFAGDFKVIKREVERHDRLIQKLQENQEKIIETQRIATQTQALGIQRFVDHLDTHKAQGLKP